jgi:ABC-2 type transport system permease protein
MTAATVPADPPVDVPVGANKRVSLLWTVRDSLAITQRNLVTLFRLPQLLVFATIQPVVFVLMFRYVFGGAIRIPGVPYVDYLMPGIFGQTVVFGAVSTAVGLSEDLHKGLIERFRSLPMARSAVLVGRTAADLVRDFFVILLMTAVGFAVGWRIHTNFFGYVAAVILLLLFGWSLTWIFAMIGLKSRNAEAAQAASFPPMAAFTFASSAFVPVATMPSWLQPFARIQPVSVTITAVRALTLGGPTLTHVLASLAWSFGIVVVCAPFAVRMYRRVT